MPSNNTKYSEEMREETAKLIINSKWSATSFAEEMGNDVNTVCRWVREYRRNHNLPSYSESKQSTISGGGWEVTYPDGYVAAIPYNPYLHSITGEPSTSEIKKAYQNFGYGDEYTTSSGSSQSIPIIAMPGGLPMPAPWVPIPVF